MKYLVSLLIVCSVISCNKENTKNNGSVLVRVQSHGGQLSSTQVSLTSDPVLSKGLDIELESVCGSDNAVYFNALPPGWYYVRASGYSNFHRRFENSDTLFEVIYRARQNHYEI